MEIIYFSLWVLLYIIWLMEKTHCQNSYKIKSKIVETEVKWIPLTGDGSKFLGRRGVMGAEGTNNE
jgi:hypothetical protein